MNRALPCDDRGVNMADRIVRVFWDVDRARLIDIKNARENPTCATVLGCLRSGTLTVGQGRRDLTFLDGVGQYNHNCNIYNLLKQDLKRIKL